MAKNDEHKQTADDFERTYGVSAKDLGGDHDAQRRLVDMAAEAEKLQATNAASTTTRYHELRTGVSTQVEPAEGDEG